MFNPKTRRDRVDAVSIVSVITGEHRITFEFFDATYTSWEACANLLGYSGSFLVFVFGTI